MGIRIGLVGLGVFGREFADLFRSHPLTDAVALCDREPERMRWYFDREGWQGKLTADDCYESFDDICRAKLDALVIITQPWLHAAQAVAAMEAGKWVYSAVPVVSLPDADETLDWCDRIDRTCRATGCEYMLGETTYYRPEAMYCRRQAAAGAFGEFVYSEGDYLHSFDSTCDLREVHAHRTNSASGREWLERIEQYRSRGLHGGPMNYPTHSISGPMSTMNAHALSVSAVGVKPKTTDPYFQQTNEIFGNEVALFEMSNGTAMRISECREIAHPELEMFRVYGTKGSFAHGAWQTCRSRDELTVEQMRDPLPAGVAEAFRSAAGENYFGGHGGSHAYLVHEFVEAVAQRRRPAIHAWQALEWMSAGATAHKSALRDGERLAVPHWAAP